ncbi:MAG: enoyl-CoA hydratase/isomerase family protein, partial [Gemmatimonadota bacterium]|jgi:enoyl-CoA hydratase/carnithine racemase
LVDWSLDGDTQREFNAWILGPIFQMASLLVHEKRGHLSHINAIGELCAQFRPGIATMIRDAGADAVIETVEAYHRLFPEAAGAAWYPEAFAALDTPEWQQLYVNAEHDGGVGVITISRETYSWAVDRELNRAMDWLKSEGIDKVIVTGDFHLSTQMLGADTSEFFPTLDSVDAGYAITSGWSATGRRLHDEFATSVAFVNGKRCLGGMLELLVHCHYLVSLDDARLGWPEVTLPVVPGMEGTHWPLRKASPDDRSHLVQMLLTGRPVKAADAVGWLVDYAGSLDDALAMTWKLASGADHGIAKRAVHMGTLDLPEAGTLPPADGPGMEAARAAIMECARASCGTSLADALTIQAKLAADFLASPACKEGVVGAEHTRTMAV